jgi:hypothetical protein
MSRPYSLKQTQPQKDHASTNGASFKAQNIHKNRSTKTLLGCIFFNPSLRAHLHVRLEPLLGWTNKPIKTKQPKKSINKTPTDQNDLKLIMIP